MQLKLGFLIGVVFADNFATSIVKAIDALNFINEDGSSTFFHFVLDFHKMQIIFITWIPFSFHWLYNYDPILFRIVNLRRLSLLVLTTLNFPNFLDALLASADRW
jgi:hypothetical protein